MSSFDTNDLKAEINTILNNSDHSMEYSNDSPKKSPKKSPQKSPKKSSSNRNSLRISDNDLSEPESKTNFENKFLNEEESSKLIKRPHNLEELVQKEMLENCNLKSSFEFNEDNSEDEEIWIMDIPDTINPMDLKNQSIQLGDKSKFKIGEERYYAIAKDSKSHFTCIFNTSNKSKVYKAVNIKPAGVLNVRKKISGISKKNFQFEQSTKVPYPQNIKTRHPLFGVHEITAKKK